MLLVLCVGVGVAARALTASFGQVEAAVTVQKALQVYRAFEADVRQLELSNRDYAEWDDAVEFVHDGNPRFITTNFVPDALNVMRVDVVWIVDASGRELYSGINDRSGRRIVSPAPAEYLRDVRQFVGNDRLAKLPPTQRLVSTSHGLAILSSLEIKRTDRSEPTGATMLFARFIEQSDVRRLRATTGLPVTILDLAGQSSAALPPPVRAWLNSRGDPAPTFVLAEDASHICGYALIRDMNHVPVALFTTRSPRDIYGLGYRTTWLMLAGVVALFIAFGAAVLWLILTLLRSFAARHSMEMRYKNVAAQLRDAIVLVDAKTHELVEANDAALAALDCEREGIRARAVQDLFPGIGSSVLDEAAARRSDRTIAESQVRRKDGGWLDAEVTITSFEIDGRQFLTVMGHDVSHRKEAEEAERRNRKTLLDLVERDSLTGLPNRLYLNSRLPKVLSNIAGGGQLLAVIYLDIDHFKNINDSRGHACGDRLLEVVAARLRAAVAMQDLVARMGGDEFVIVAPLAPDLAAVEALAARVQAAVSGPIAAGGGLVTVTASLGTAVYPRDGADARTLLKHADIALHQAKDAGRNCHRFFQSDMDLRVSEHVALEQALRHAVGSGQIFMVYQPVIDLRSGDIVSLEALMRWRHPERGLIPPGQFIPVAEKSGLIVELGGQALTQVMAQVRAWLAKGVPVVPVAVNVSSLQIDRTDFAALVSDLARQAALDPRWLRFEITESALMKEPDKLIGVLQALRSMGAQTLIDDFGTGYSSLNYLNRLPVDMLKIDRSFIQDLRRRRAGTAILSATIEMAKKLGLKTVAEGVETEEQAKLLRWLGCDFAQGYYFSKPVSAEQCRSVLLHARRYVRERLPEAAGRLARG
jgi:diguanylate cyclase (GGDEF)-like protein/PAS domain S-box-containing protein